RPLRLPPAAEAEGPAPPRPTPAGHALIAYARGANDSLTQARRSGEWPSIYGLTGVYPRSWTPVDSLVLQGVLTQQLDYTTTPLGYPLLERTLRPPHPMARSPILPPAPQPPPPPPPSNAPPLPPPPPPPTPPTPPQATPVTTADVRQPAQAPAAGPGTSTGGVTARAARAAAAILAQTDALPAGAVHQYPDSNAWAANGPKVAGAKAMLAGDPH